MKQPFWFPEPGASVLDFRQDTMVPRAALTTIPTGIIGTRTSTIILMPGIDTHIIPHPQHPNTRRTGRTTVIIDIIATDPG